MVSVNREELKWCQLTLSPQGPHFSPQSKAKPMIKARISGCMVSVGISDVVTATVYSEKNSLKKFMMIMIIFFAEKTFISK